MPAPSTPRWSRRRAPWRRTYRAQRQRTRAARGCVHPGSGLQPQREWRAGVAVRPAQAASRGRRAELRPRHGALHLAAGRWLVLPHPDDRALRRAGQPGPLGLDGRGGPAESAARRGLADATTARRSIRPRAWSGSRRSRPSSGRARAREIRVEGRRRGINACVVDSPADVLADPHLHARDFWETRDGLRVPRRFALLREERRRKAPGWNRRNSRTGRSLDARRSAGWRAHPGLLLGAGRFDHDQGARRPGCRCDQGRKPHTALPVAARCAGLGVEAPRTSTTSPGLRTSIPPSAA